MLADKDVGLEVICEEATLVLFPVAGALLMIGISDPDEVVRTGGRDGIDRAVVSDTMVGNVSVIPPSL